MTCENCKHEIGIQASRYYIVSHSPKSAKSIGPLCSLHCVSVSARNKSVNGHDGKGSLNVV